MEGLFFVLVLLGMIVLIMLLQYHNSKKSDKLYVEQLNSHFGDPEKFGQTNDARVFPKHADDYFKRHSAYGQIDDITWNDLDMDDFFSMVNTTQSDIGCEVLYHMLRSPVTDENQLNQRREEIRFWIDNPNIRNRILLELHHMGHLRRFSLYDGLDSIRDLEKRSCTHYVLWIVLLVLSVALIYPLRGVGVIIFLIILAHNLILYYREKAEISPYLASFEHILKLMDAAKGTGAVLKSCDLYKNSSDGISSCMEKLGAFRRKNGIIKNWGGEGNILSIVIELAGALVFAELIRFNLMVTTLKDNLECVDNLIGSIGELDAVISMADYVCSCGDRVCVPQIYNGSDGICMKDICHPLIMDPIANDFENDGSILLTGANASGKSTFLRTVGLCAVMSQTFGYVCARQYRAPFFIVLSSMSLSDDIISGDSYYMAEIKSVKRIFDECAEAKRRGLKTICFIDELLRGTNTVERIAAAACILKKLDEDGAIVCAATHDRELTGLLDKYTNYHFEEQLTDGDVTFTYKLTDGPAVSRNAILLLDKLGFDENMIRSAQKMVDEFEKDGYWKTED